MCLNIPLISLMDIAYKYIPTASRLELGLSCGVEFTDKSSERLRWLSLVAGDWTCLSWNAASQGRCVVVELLQSVELRNS